MAGNCSMPTHRFVLANPHIVLMAAMKPWKSAFQEPGKACGATW